MGRCRNCGKWGEYQCDECDEKELVLVDDEYELEDDDDDGYDYDDDDAIDDYF